MGMYTMDATEGHDYRPGQRNTGIQGLMTGGLPFGGGLPPETQKIVEKSTLAVDTPDPTARGLLRAWDPVAQETVWEVETPGWWDRAGVLATGGGLVFQGTATGFFRVYDDKTGEMLKEIDIGTGIVAAPVSYAVDGTQYVAVMAAKGSVPLSMAPQPEAAHIKYGNDGRILAFKLDGGPTPKPEPVDRGPIPEPPTLDASEETIARGEALFNANCAACHTQIPGAESPDLRRMNQSAHENFTEIVLGGTPRPLGMPQLVDVLDKRDVDAIPAYLISLSWPAYKTQPGKAAD
jgi:quinohemoprotein ethanol dehydrogenase